MGRVIITVWIVFTAIIGVLYVVLPRPETVEVEELELAGFPTPDEDIGVLSAEPCPSDEGGSACTKYQIHIECGGGYATSTVWEHTPTSTSIGSIILTTGGTGEAQYGRTTVRQGTRDLLFDGGFQIYEIGYGRHDSTGNSNNRGWLRNGDGYSTSTCTYKKVVDWIHNDVARHPEAICAHGNSGGGWLPISALVHHGADTMIDFVLPTAGPPLPQLDEYCFDPDYALGLGGVPNASSGAAIRTDYVHDGKTMETTARTQQRVETQHCLTKRIGIHWSLHSKQMKTTHGRIHLCISWVRRTMDRISVPSKTSIRL